VQTLTYPHVLLRAFPQQKSRASRWRIAEKKHIAIPATAVREKFAQQNTRCLIVNVST
jgi:hypothetical protein